MSLVGDHLLSRFCSTSPPVRARRRHGPAVADREPTSATELNLCRCTKAQDRLKILPKSFPPSILLWLPPVRPTTSAANDGN